MHFVLISLSFAKHLNSRGVMHHLRILSFVILLAIATMSGNRLYSDQSYLEIDDLSSVSDNNDWRGFCYSAATNDAVFQNFKNSSLFRIYMEHVSYELGLKYLDVIKNKYPDLLPYMGVFRTNDTIGNPIVYSYDVGYFSPTTFRYIKTAGDIKKQFGDLSGMKIIEIGGGYGAQCKILMDLFCIKEYVIVDLPETIALTKKYLSYYGIKNVRFLTPEQLGQESCDLVISNFTFSECNGKVQDYYFDKIIKNSLHGYMCMNFMNLPFKYPSHKLLEVFTMLGDAGMKRRVWPEDPQSGGRNLIIVWNKIDKESIASVESSLKPETSSNN